MLHNGFLIGAGSESFSVVLEWLGIDMNAPFLRDLLSDRPILATEQAPKPDGSEKVVKVRKGAKEFDLDGLNPKF